MHMAPITRAQPAPSSPLGRRLVGTLVLLANVAAMLPWLAVNPAISGAVIGVLALACGPRALIQAIDQAGEVAPGR